MEKIKFRSAILSNKDEKCAEFKEFEGSIIKIKGIEFYCYKDELYKKNYVIDKNTGLSINTLYKTKKEALESASNNIDKYLELIKTEEYKKFKEEYERNC